MGKKNKTEKKNYLAAAIREDAPDRIIKGLNMVREFAIPAEDDIYLSVLSNAKGRSRETDSEAWVLMNGLYYKVCSFLEKLQEGAEDNIYERQELLDAISEANNTLVEKLTDSPKPNNYNPHFYLQHYITDLAFARAKEADQVFDLLGMYYYLLGVWNDEQSGSEEVRKLFGEASLSDFIEYLWTDILICDSCKKFDGIKWKSYLGNNAQNDDRPHIQALSEAVCQRIENLKGNAKTTPPPVNTKSVPDGKGSVSSGKSPHNRGTVKGPAGKGGEEEPDSAGDDYREVMNPGKADSAESAAPDREDNTESAAQGSGKNSKEKKEKPQKESGWRKIVLALIVIVSMIFGGIVGYIVGASKGQSHSSDIEEFTGTSETADQGNTEISAEGVTTGEGVEYQQKEDKSDPAGKDSSKQDAEPEAVDEKDGNAAESEASEQGGGVNAESGTSGQGEEESAEPGSSEQDGQESKKSGSEDQPKQSESEDKQDVDAVDKGKEGVEYKLEEKQELRLERRKVIFKHDIL